MKKYRFFGTQKIPVFLLLVFLITLIPSASASMMQVKDTSSYEQGYQAGSQSGYLVGYSVGHNDCINFGRKEVTTKIDNPKIKREWSNEYIKGYTEGFTHGFLAGYNNARFQCLKNK